jgi:hypothetical protein
MSRQLAPFIRIHSAAAILLHHASLTKQGMHIDKHLHTQPLTVLQETTVTQWIQYQQHLDEFNTLLNAEMQKAAASGGKVMIPVRYELERQDDLSPMQLSAEPLEVHHHLSVCLFACLSLCLSVCLSVRPIRPSVRPFGCVQCGATGEGVRTVEMMQLF